MPQRIESPEANQTLSIGLAEARALTDSLFRIVKPGSMYERPIAERHRIIFYLGHLEAFDWNLIGRLVLGLNTFHKHFDRLFAFGIDPVGGGLPTDQPSDWPRQPEIERYNRRIRDTLDGALSKVSFSNCAEPLLLRGSVLNVAIEHRLMHAETLAYMLHQLPIERKLPQADPAAPTPQADSRQTVTIPAGSARLGRPRGETNGFGWDNEFEATTVEVPEFTMDTRKITNRQYLDFMNSDGYETREYWSAEGWHWKCSEGVRLPVFWTRRGERWFYRTMFEEIPLPQDWPVYVSHAEAAAYARAAGKSLPTEAEFHRAAYATPEGVEREYPWGNQHPEARFGNFDFRRWNPVPVGSFPSGTSAFGVTDLLGNGWEWTSTVFAPFPGFEPFPFYPGYSANFFDGKHYVAKGGSARTAARLLRRSFRNWFQAQYPYVYAGFRCVAHEA